MSLVILKPAYGRTYDNYRDLLSDWNSGKDFYIRNGAYCSRRNLEAIKRDLGADRIYFQWMSKGCKTLQSKLYWESDISEMIITSYTTKFPR